MDSQENVLAAANEGRVQNNEQPEVASEQSTTVEQQAQNVADKAEEAEGGFFDKLKSAVDTIADKAGDIADSIADKAGDAVDAAKDLAEKAADKAEDFADAVADKAEDAMDAAKDFAEKAADKAEDFADTIADKAEDAMDAAKDLAAKAADKAEDFADAVADKASDIKDAATDKANDIKAGIAAGIDKLTSDDEEKEEGKEEKPEMQKKIYESEEEVLKRAKEIAHSDEPLQKDEIDHLKTTFYRLHLAKKEEQYQEYLKNGGDPEAYQPMPDILEQSFKAEMGVIRERRAKELAKQEAEKEENLKKKKEIIEKIKEMAASPESANKSYQEFRNLQQQWKEIKNIPPAKANELWKTYQLYVEQFYDQLKLNSEAREYDFKKNLQIKTQICEAAEKLADEPDVISAFHQLQKLHQQFRETGPVAKNLREEVWARFKAASTVINKRHQQHFEELRGKEEENLAKKTALCEQAEEVAKTEAKKASEWDKLTKKLLDIQAEWKTIGFAPQKMNTKIFERFRAACDDFFSKKAQYFKDVKQQYSENANKKRELVEKAKALMDSTDWKKTSDQMIQLQKQWKTIGMAPRKLGDKLWEEFTAACNHFFEARNAATGNQRSEERTNLEQKKEIVEKIKALLDEPEEGVKEKFDELTAQYNSIGHVPFKEKDAIREQYRKAVDDIYEKFHLSPSQRKLDSFKSSLKNIADKGVNALDNERARLVKQYDQIKSEVQTYENNLGFLNASSKKGNSLVEELKKKVEKLKEDLELVKQKVKAIDEQNKQQQ